MSVTSTAGEFAYALQYAKYREGTTEPLKSKGRITFADLPLANDTVTINGTVYKFVAALSAGNDILIGTNVRACVENLYNAMMGGTGAGTAYHAATAPAIFTDVALSELSNVLSLTAFIYGTDGDAYTIATNASPRITVSAATLTGGIKGGDPLYALARIGFEGNVSDGDVITIGAIGYRFKSTMAQANDVKLGVDLATSLAHLLKTINGQGVALTDYYTGTVSPDATVSAEVSNNMLMLKTKVAGAAGNTTALVATVDSGTVMNLSGATFAGGRDRTPYDRTTFNWKRMPTLEINYGEQQMQDMFPPEILGPLTPLGAYKGAVFAGGGATLLPRFEDSLGELLLAVLGSSTTVDNGTHGVHTFRFRTSDESYVPWMTVRKKVPGRNPVPAQGLIVYDNIMTAFALQLAQASPVQANIGLIGRLPILDNDPDTWPASGVETFKSVPITCRASFTLPTIFEGTLPTTAVQVALQNQTTTQREELIIGSYYLDDLVVLRRMLQLQFTLKWSSPDMYQRAFGGLSKQSWTPEPFVTEASGGNYAFELKMETSYNIPGTQIPYSLSILPQSCVWQPGGPPRMTAAQLVTQDWTATALNDASGTYVDFVLVNGRTTPYTVPSEP